MLDFFKNKDRSGADDQPSQLDGRTIARLMRYFPVGARVNYYPEYRKELLLESVVIAYAINGELIYSAADPDCDEASGVLELHDQGARRVFSTINSFRIVVPVFNQSENKLDYARREELLKVGGLVNGNTITLMAENRNGQVPVLETEVEKRTILQQGFYSGQTVALLDVHTDSLLLTDQRAHLRLKTRLPATVQVTRRGETSLLNGVMVDFSDRSLRLVIDAGFVAEALPRAGNKVVVSFNMPGQSEHVSLVGEVYRVEGTALVLMLNGMVQKGQMVKLGQIETLKIKATLLQHGATNLAR